MIWTVPDDLRRFAQKTRGKPVIMGRKTFESIIAANGRPLVERPNIVVSRSSEFAYPGVIVVHSLDEAFEEAFALGPEEVHVGGGSEVYRQVLPLVDRLYLTLFHDDRAGDTMFPQFEPDFREVDRHGIREHGGVEYEWVDYVRVG